MTVVGGGSLQGVKCEVFLHDTWAVGLQSDHRAWKLKCTLCVWGSAFTFAWKHGDNNLHLGVVVRTHTGLFSKYLVHERCSRKQVPLFSFDQ